MMFSAIISTLAMVLLATSVVASPVTVNSTLAAREPARRGGFIDDCYMMVDSPNYVEYRSEIDLNLCMGNYNNHLDWGYLGGAMASCTNCLSRWMDTRYLDCDCGSIDLNEGIYMADNGAIACYDQVAIPYAVVSGTVNVY